MKKKYENFWNMYSNCFNTIKAFAQKKFPIAPQNCFLLCQNHIFNLVYNYSTLKVQPVTVYKDHAQYGKKEAKDI